MSAETSKLAESICVLFGKAYKPQGHPDMGGIEDKVLSDVIMLINGMLRTRCGPMEADRDSALLKANTLADALQHAEIQLAQSVCAEEHRQVMSERDEAHADCNVLNQMIDTLRAERDEARNALVDENAAHFLRVQALEKERDAPEGLRDQLGGAERRIVALTQERDEARANAAALLSRAAKCPLSLSHEWSCPLLEPSLLRAENEEADRGR